VFIIWCLSGMTFLAVGIFQAEQPARLYGAWAAFIFIFYTPMIMIGLGTMARRRVWLWLGAAASALDLVVALAILTGPNPISGLTQMDNLFGYDAGRYALFSLLSILVGVQFFGYTVALVAYYSNPHSVR
jgi:hypothetical protein